MDQDLIAQRQDKKTVPAQSLCPWILHREVHGSGNQHTDSGADVVAYKVTVILYRSVRERLSMAQAAVS